MKTSYESVYNQGPVPTSRILIPFQFAVSWLILLPRHVLPLLIDRELLDRPTPLLGVGR